MQRLSHHENQKLVDEAISVLASTPFFTNIASTTLANALQDAATCLIEPGEILIREGDEDSDNFYIHLSGEFEIYKDEQLILKLSQPGQLIGELAIITKAPRYGSVIAKSACEVIEMDAKIIRETTEHRSELALAVSQMITQVLTEKIKLTSERAKLYERTLLKSQEYEEYSHELERDLENRLEQIRLYSEVVEHNQDAILVVDREGTIKLTNSAIKELFYFQPKELISESISRIIDGILDEDKDLNRLYRYSWKGERLATHKDGSQFPAFITITPIQIDSKSKEASIFAIEVRDISLQKAYEDNILKKNVELKTTYHVLEETVEELEKSNKIKNEFFSSVSTQLKTPLISIHSFVDYLLKTYSPEMKPGLLEYLEKIQLEEKKLENMVENILTMTELNEGLANLKLKPNRISELVSELDQRYPLDVKEKRKKLSPTQNLIICDEVKIIKAIGECVDFLTKESQGTPVYLYVDYDANNQHHIFTLKNAKTRLTQTDEVQTAERIAESIEKIDLELPVANRIAQLHKGEIKLVETADLLQVSLILPTEPEKGTAQVQKIMIIDPDSNQRKTYRRLIESIDIPTEVTEFKDQMSALNAVNAIYPDVVLLEPVFDDGYLSYVEFVDELKSAKPEQTELFVISDVMAEDKSRNLVLNRGIRDYLIKPFSHDELTFRLNALLIAKQQLNILSKHIQKAQQSAVTDQLTGIFNRRYYDRFLNEQLVKAEMQGTQLSLILLDIDNFKHYNDTNGHQVGDEGLQITAEVLKQGLRGSDMVARYGGEEFVVVLPNTSKKMAGVIAEKLRVLMEEAQFPLENSQPLGKITASFGVTTYPIDDQNGEALLKKADECLYKAKEQGRNIVITYGED